MWERRTAPAAYSLFGNGRRGTDRLFDNSLCCILDICQVKDYIDPEVTMNDFAVDS